MPVQAGERSAETRRALEPPGPGTAGPGDVGRPKRPALHSCVDWRYLLSWLAVAAAGLFVALIPAFPGQDLLSSSVVGAGVAGLLTEFTFWFDRRDTKFDFLVEQHQYADLERQVGRVDSLAQETYIITVNQLFQLGIEAAQCRFLDGQMLDSFRAETEQLAEILRVADAVRNFLSSPWMRAKDGLAPKGEDPFPAVMDASRMRYSLEGVEALKSGYIVGVGMQRPQELAGSKEYRDKVAEMLHGAANSLFLLPQTIKNLTRVSNELKSGSCNPRHFIGYMSLFSFYLTYRRTGQFPDVAHLFEAPLTLTDRSMVKEVARALARLSGQALEVPEPEMPEGRTAPTAEPVAAAPAGNAPGEAAPAEGAGHYIRKPFVAFWLAVMAAGVAVGLSSLSFTGKSLVSPAIVGAGIAGVLSEVIYCFDRRRDAARVAAKHQQYLGLSGHIIQVDELMRKADIIRINQSCRLGYDLGTIRFGPDDRVQPTIAEAQELADILHVPAAFAAFANDPYLRAKQPPGGHEPISAMHDALQLRYSQEVIAAFNAGTTIGVVVSNMAGLADNGIQAQVVRRLKDVAKLLELPEAVNDNVRRVSQELLDGSYQPRDFGLYLFLFPVYLNHRMTGQYEDVAALFEARTPLAPPESAGLVSQIVSRLAGGQSGGHREAEPTAVATVADQDPPPVSRS